MRIFVISALLAALSSAAFADGPEDYSGYYWNQTKDAIFELSVTASDTGPSIEGVTRWSEKPAVDAQNPDPALKDRDLIGAPFLWDFSYDKRKNRWKDGKVYDPNNGKTYNAKMELADNGQTLKMRGYIGISLLGRTERFQRVAPADFPSGFNP